MRSFHFLTKATLLLSNVSFLYGGSYNQDFSGFPPGATDLGDGSVIASNDGFARIAGTANPYLRMTEFSIGNTNSSFKMPDLDPGREIESFTASFEILINGSGTIADGISFTFGAIPGGNGGGEAGFPVEGGLVIAWDTYNNGGDTPSVEVFVDGVSVSNTPYDYSSNAAFLKPVEISWDGRLLNLDFDGETLVSDLAIPGFVPAPGGRFAFSGRTGGLTQNTFLDSVSITTGTIGPITTSGPIISEFVADNDESLTDEELDSPDWIEIYNGEDTPTGLAGYYLTNDLANKTMWQFPTTSLNAYEYLIVFASGKDRGISGAPLHTNFTLEKAGGYLALIAPDGTTVLSEYTFGEQAEDISYGELGGDRTRGYLETPTPSAKNIGLQADGPPAEDVTFSRDGGLFRNSTSVSIEALESPTGVVRYTTDGTLPTESSSVYSSALSISNTTTVRARVFDPGKLPGELSSRTFVELASDMNGFSSNLPIVVADSAGVNIDAASNPGGPRPFRFAYTVVIDRDEADGLARIDGEPDFAGRGGMHVRGQSSSGFPKKQYAWEIWNNEDEDKEASILGMPEESDWILHAPYSDKTLMRNAIVYETAYQLHGSQGGMRTRYVELFFNQNGGTVSMNDYRGVYLVMEKIKRDNNRVDIEKLNDSVTDPDLITGGYIFKKDKGPYSQPWTTARERVPLDMHEPEQVNSAQFDYLRGYVNDFEEALYSPSFAESDQGYAAYIEPGSFIDMHLFVETFKEIDGYRISTYFTKDRGKKIKALPVWDYNLALGNADYLGGENPTGWYYPQVGGSDYYWYDRLFQDTEFTLAYWDRFWELRQKEFSTAGLLALIDAHDAELGGSMGSPNAVTRNFDEWNILGRYVWPNASGSNTRQTHQAEVDWMKNWLTNRLTWIETQSRGTGGVARPPGFSQYGGVVPSGSSLTMTESNGWVNGSIYYTIDGSDPRNRGNSSGGSTTLVSENSTCQVLVPTSDNGGDLLSVSDWTGLSAPANSASWIEGTQGVGYERSGNNRYDPLINVDVETEMYDQTETCYIRIPFTIGSQQQIEEFSELFLRMRYDDGFVAYLNGAEIWRENAPDQLGYQSGATTTHDDALAEVFSDFPISGSLDLLKVGSNMLAIHALNRQRNSSDAVWAAELVGRSGGGSGPSPTAQVYSEAVRLDQSSEIKARAYDGNQWSPLSRGLFVIDAVPASTNNLVVSEFHYRPGSPTAEEEARGFLSRGDFEFIELMNIDPTNPITLEGVTFVDGISFDGFDESISAEALVLSPGARVVLVKSTEAFNFRYPNSNATIAGEFGGSLSNDGEQVVLNAANGLVIKDFTYNDVAPWPTAADGEGFTLLLNTPSENPDHDNASSWRASSVIGGTPGSGESGQFTGDPNADEDGDNLTALYEYASGTSDLDASSQSLPAVTWAPFEIDGVTANYVVIDFQMNESAVEISYELQASMDLKNWSVLGDGVVLVSETSNGDGTAVARYRMASPFLETDLKGFYRLKVTR